MSAQSSKPAVSPTYTRIHAHTRIHNFEARIPRGVLLMLEDGIISRSVYTFIGCLLDYKSKDKNTVDPKIRTLAARLHCCTRTVRRWIDAAEAAGLIKTTLNRDAHGRVKSLIFDLSNIFAMGVKKVRAAAHQLFSKVTSVSTSPNVSRPTPYAQSELGGNAENGSLVDTEVRESYKQDIAEQARRAADDLVGADALSYKALLFYKVRADAAVRYAVERGSVVVGAAIKRLRKAMNRDHIKTPAGYLVTLLEDGAFVEEVLAGLATEPGVREYIGGKPVDKYLASQSAPTHKSAPVPREAPPASAPSTFSQNPLDGLAAEALGGLEVRARGELAVENTPAGSIYRGYDETSPVRHRMVKRRMRELVMRGLATKAETP